MNCIEQDIQNGIKFGYNMCCIKNYINLQLLGYFPGIFMYIVLGQDDFKDHVLCPICYEKYNKRNPNRNHMTKDWWGKGPAVDAVLAEYEQLRDSI
jgi:hypothetical protein